MIRSLRDEVERYGPYSLAAESMYDHPFQWGSKADRARSRPGRRQVFRRMARGHIWSTRATWCPESIMPGYPWLLTTPAKPEGFGDFLVANRIAGVPYSDEMIDAAEADFIAQAQPDSDEAEAVAARYPKAVVRDFDANPEMVSEMDALVAYMQMLGTLVDFSVYDATGSNQR